MSDKTVASLRPVTAEIRSERTYTTKHGTVAKMNTSAIGKANPKEDDMQTAEIFPTAV